MGVPDLEHSGLEVNPERTTTQSGRNFPEPADDTVGDSAPSLRDRAREFEDRRLQLGRCTLDQARGFDGDWAELCDATHELTRGYTETNRERHDRAQGWIATTVFDGADIVRGETGSFR